MFTSLAIGLFTSQQKVAFVESFSHWSSGSLGVKTNWFTTTPHTWLSRILSLFKYFAQGFKLSPSIPLTRTFTVKNNFSIALSWPGLHLRQHTKELKFRSCSTDLLSVRINSSLRYFGFIQGVQISEHIEGQFQQVWTPVTIQLIRYFQISWPDVALLILKTVNVCIVTFLFFWRDRHRNSETKTKKRTQVCKVARINHGVSKIFQGLIRWSTELQLKPNLSEYVNDERPFVFKIRKEGILRGTVSTMIYMLKREITKAKFKFISFVSSKYAFAMFSSRWSKDLTSLKKERNYLGIYYPTYFLVLIMSCPSNEPFSIVTNSKYTFQTYLFRSLSH